jgi:hypothetical protein
MRGPTLSVRWKIDIKQSIDSANLQFFSLGEARLRPERSKLD